MFHQPQRLLRVEQRSPAAGADWHSLHLKGVCHGSDYGQHPVRVPWNKGKFTGQKPPLKLKEIWAIRIRLQLSARTRDLEIFNLAIDSKLRACDLTKLRVREICHGQHVASRTTVMQQKTQRPVQFELTEQTRDSAEAWIRTARLSQSDFLFPSRIYGSPHLSTRQYARIVHRWIASIGLDDTAYGTHTMRLRWPNRLRFETDLPDGDRSLSGKLRSVDPCQRIVNNYGIGIGVFWMATGSTA